MTLQENFINKLFFVPDNLHFIYKAHVQVSQLFQGCNILLVTFRVKNIVSFCVKKLLHFALKSCYILRQKLLHFVLMLHFASIVTFCGVTVVHFGNHSYDYRPSWTLLSPITVISKSYLKVISKCSNFARNYYYFAKLAIFTFSETGNSFLYTVFIRISAQPRIGAHLE